MTWSAGTVVSLLRPGDEAAQRHGEAMRAAEALLFVSALPLTATALAARLPPGSEVETILRDLARLYAARGVNLVEVAGGWAFRTAPDLASTLAIGLGAAPKLSPSEMEVLAIIAYHQPVSLADIEEMRGVNTFKGTLDVLLATGWVRIRGRRRAPGQPLTYGTAPAFLDHFGLRDIGDLPDAGELQDMGVLDRGSDGLSMLSLDDPLPLREDKDLLEPDQDS